MRWLLDGEEGEGKGGGDPLRGESGSKVAPRCRVAALGTHQAANGCAELYSRWRPTALFLPRPPPPLASVLRSQSHHQVARRWNGWSPNTHHHLSCAWEARVQVAPRGCGSSGQAGECGVHRGCPAPGQQGDRRQERGGGLTRGRDFALSSLDSLPHPFSQPDAGTCWQSFSAASGSQRQGAAEGPAARALRRDPGAGRAEAPHLDTGHRPQARGLSHGTGAAGALFPPLQLDLAGTEEGSLGPPS